MAFGLLALTWQVFLHVSTLELSYRMCTAKAQKLNFKAVDKRTYAAKRLKRKDFDRYTLLWAVRSGTLFYRCVQDAK